MMKRRRKRFVLGVVAVAAIAVGLLVVRFQQTPASAAPGPALSPLRAAITIDSQVGEIFAPASASTSASAAPAMTAQLAWKRWARLNGSDRSAIPSGVTVRLGLLTLPSGHSGPNGAEAYTARNELVYGYSFHSCGPISNPRAALPANNPCVEWTFIDANTGRLIDETWQQ